MTKNTAILFLLIITILSISACSSSVPEKHQIRIADDEPFKIDTIISSSEAAPTTESRPLFTYNESPLMNYDGGLKLRGIIYGSPTIAVIEIADHCFYLVVGQKICGYKLAQASGNKATIYKNGKKIILEML